MNDLQPPKRYHNNEEDEQKIVKHKSSGVKSLKNSGLFTVGGFDIPFFVLVLAILSIGLIMLFSASYPYALQNKDNSYFFVIRQLGFAVAGFVAMLVASKLNYKLLKVIEKPLLAATIFFLILVLFYHTDVGEFKRWIPLIGSATFQPSDIAKFSIILSLAAYISNNFKKMNSFIYGIVIPGIYIFIFCILILLERHLSCTILVFLMGLSLMFVGGSNKTILAIGIGVLVAIAIFVYIHPEVLPGYNTERIIAFKDKTYEPTKARWQTNNSLYAIGSGGLTGVGLGNSKQKFLYVSEPQNDFIFAIVCEELGFLGAGFIVLLFAALFLRGVKIATRTNDRFASLIVIGIVSQVALQTIFNILVVTDTIPNTGIALPFFSYGGTSLLMLMFEMGVVLSISRRANQKTV